MATVTPRVKIGDIEHFLSLSSLVIAASRCKIGETCFSKQGTIDIVLNIFSKSRIVIWTY
jgi:hypothetical protein